MKRHMSSLLRRVSGLGLLKTLVICVLIVSLLFSLSIGLSYARFRTVVTPEDATVFNHYNVQIGKNEDIQYVKENEDTVLTLLDGKIKVIIPAGTTCRVANTEAYILRLMPHDNNGLTFDSSRSENQYRLSYKLCLFALRDTRNADRYANYAATRVAGGNALSNDCSIIYELPAGATGGYNNPSLTFDFDEGISTYKTKVFGSGTAFSVWFDILGSWTALADTDWYDDTASDVYTITSAAQLAGLAKIVNSGTDSFSGCTIKLGDDISLNNRLWVPIGTLDHPFSGDFDGQGYTISDLNVKKLTDDADTYGVASKNMTAGLFGRILGTGSNTISDLIIRDANISARLQVSAIADEKCYTSQGTVAGFSEGYNISNVHVSGLTMNGTSYYAGGIIGRGDGRGSVTNCSVENATMAPNIGSFGGIIGIHYGDGHSINVSNCYVKADINCGRITNAGGIIGFINSGSVGLENCYFTTYNSGITGADHNEYTYNGAYNIGGIVGTAFSNPSASAPGVVINNCYCNADIPAARYILANSNASDDDEFDEYGNRINPRYKAGAYEYVEAYNCSWSGDESSHNWYSAGYSREEDTASEHTILKSSDCWFAGVSLTDSDEFFDFINGKTTPSYPAMSRVEYIFNSHLGSVHQTPSNHTTDAPATPDETP